MKCFSIKSGEVAKGVPDTIPHDPAVKSTKTGMITEAEFVLEASDKEDDFGDIMDEDLSGASELAYFELTKAAKKTRGKKAPPDDYILVAFDPAEYRRAPEYGDQSEILYKSIGTYLALVQVENCYLFPHASKDCCFTVKDGKLVKDELTFKDVKAMDRSAIERRRERGDTSLFTIG